MYGKFRPHYVRWLVKWSVYRLQIRIMLQKSCAATIFSRGHTTLELAVSVRRSVRRSVRNDRVEKWKIERFGYYLCMFVCGVGVGVWIWVGCPCPPDIVTPLHLFLVADTQLYKRLCPSVGLLVRPSVGPLVRLFVTPVLKSRR